MNGKKARALRKIFRDQGSYSEKEELKSKKVKKVAYFPDLETGQLKAKSVEMHIVYNMSKYGYRRAKKDYATGKIKF